MSLDPREILSPLVSCRHRKLVIAVSGGSDSLGLLLLAAGLVTDSSKLLAVTVDHGLRPQAAEEARAVAAFCALRGIGHRTLVWQGEKPRTGLIAAAREARYALLAEAACDFGADTLLVGHTMDDQAETVAMRARRGAGSGLAGMAEATLYDGRVWIVRPLLGLRRAAIRQFLVGQDVRWIDDPSNENEAFERVRTRFALSDAEIEAFAEEAAGEGTARTALASDAARLIARFATMPAPGLIRLDPAIFSMRAEQNAAAVHALRALLGLAGGTQHLPDRARVEAMFNEIAAGSARATLSRALVDSRRSGIWIRREERALPSLELDGSPLIWDARWRLSGHGLTVSALGSELASTYASPAAQVPESLARAALAIEPALFSGGTFVALASDAAAISKDVNAYRIVAPFARFLPGFDLDLAGALARLADAPPPPSPPWRRHIATRP